jgi:hypothetical protein
MPFFLFSLVSFVSGIFIFNYLHTEDIDYIDGYSYFIIAGVLSRLAECFSEPPGHDANSDPECYFASTDWPLAL